MELGVCIASKIDDIDHVLLAESLGFSAAWFADSQMIWSDPYACLALAADRTTSIRLGTGVSVAATRPAPVTASSIASINRIAPDRTFLGIGTGNTAMRMMGHKPMRIAEYEAYLNELGPLLRGEEAEVAWRGQTSPVRHLMPDAGFVDFDHPIPLYVSGFGPRSLGLAGAFGDGAVFSIPPDPSFMERTWRHIEAGAQAVGRPFDRSQFFTCSLSTIVVTNEGEARDSARVKEQAGAFAIASLHYSYDQWRQFGRRPSGPVAGVWDDYVALLDEVPEDVRHQRIHAGHNCWVIPEEEQFLTSELLDATCVIGTADEVVARLRALGEAGLDQLMILPPLAPRDDVLRAVGRDVLPRL